MVKRRALEDRAAIVVAAFVAWSGCGETERGDASMPSGGAGGAGAPGGGSAGSAGGSAGSGGGSAGSAGGSAGSAGGSAGSAGGNVFVDQIRTDPGLCLPRSLSSGAAGSSAGTVPCSMFELSFPAAGCLCDVARGRGAAPAAFESAVRERAAVNGLCDVDGDASCDSACICELLQLAGTDLESCQNDDVVPDDVYGFCYIDAEAGIGNPALVADCPESQRRRLRLVGADVPAPGASMFVACTG